ncbi:cofilin [Acarospora aff. strigata]|nr:cofilin [Acarospora aff. strigata]
MSSTSGVSVAPECISTFNELKLGKGSIKFIIYKLSDDYKQVVVEETSQEPEWDVFRNKLLSAKTVHKGKEGNGPRYAVYDFEYELAAGEGKRNKITFISWIPDDSPMVPRFTYTSSKDALKRSLNGIAVDIQANDKDDIEYGEVLHKVSKGVH